MNTPATIAIAIATTRRASLLNETLREIQGQTRRPDLIAICPAHDDDVDMAFLSAVDLPIRLSRGPVGASAQRNALLRDMPEVDLVLFLDDDFFPAPNYVEALERFFGAPAHADVALVTGTLIADGANGPGIDAADARRLIATAPRPANGPAKTVFSGYGCNMAVRGSILSAHHIRFDENMPLYSWAEDLAFSRQIARFGRLLKSVEMTGVHLGTKQGRTSDLRLGYSQIANQAYLRHQGVIPAHRAAAQAARNLLANLHGAFRSETYIDRRGRLVGNLYGLMDLVRGRSSPQRILEL